MTRFNCKIDLWHMDDTWAKTAGHVKVERPHDLLRCTFFDWDSAIYELGTRKLTMAPGYLERLHPNVIDVCLEPNPNHTGAFVRALRRAAQWNASFGSRLSMFALRMVRETAWSEVVALDERAFLRPVLKYIDRDDLVRRLGESDASGVTTPVPGGTPQMRLPLERVGPSGDDAPEHVRECAVA